MDRRITALPGLGRLRVYEQTAAAAGRAVASPPRRHRRGLRVFRLRTTE